MNKTIIVGAGGTGIKIIRHLRKHLIEMGKPLDMKNELGYLYIDTDTKDVQERNTARWQVLGKNMCLNESEYETLSCPPINEIRNSYDSFDDLNDWFPYEELKSIDLAANDTPGASQIRPLGKYAFYFSKSKVKEKFLSCYNKLRNSGETPQIYICCSLSGGTGAGIFLDLVYSIREWLPDHNSSDIHGYLVLPKLSVDYGDKYICNAFAALQELNYYSIDKITCNDEEKPVIYKCMKSGRKFDCAPFDFCFLVSHMNGSNVELSTDALAQMISERIYLDMDTGFISKANAHLNNAKTDRTNYFMDSFSGDKRSRNFFTFGLSKIKYPLDKIIDTMSYKICINVYDKLLNDSDVPGNMNELVANELSTFKLIDSYILGDMDLFGNNNHQSPDTEIDDMIKDIEINFKGDHRERIPDTFKNYRQTFINTFRNSTVTNYYTEKSKNIDGSADVIMKLILNKLSKKLTIESVGMKYTTSFINEIDDKVNSLISKYSNILNGVQTTIDTTNKNLDKSLSSLKDSSFKWFRNGRSLNSQLDNCKSILKSNLNSIIAEHRYRYGKDLLTSVDEKLKSFKKTVDNWKDKMTKLRDSTKKKISSNIDYFNKLNGKHSDFNGYLLFRESIIDDSFDNNSLENAVDYCIKNMFTLESKSVFDYPEMDSNGQKLYCHAFDWLSTSDVKGAIDTNVVKVFCENFEDSFDKIDKIAATYRKSAPFGKFDQVAINANELQSSCFATIVGLYNDESLVSESQSTNEAISGGTNIPNDCILPIDNKHEMIFLQETTAFSIDFLLELKRMKEEYDNYIKTQNALPLHLEKSYDPPLQRLFKYTKSEVDQINKLRESFFTFRSLGTLKKEYSNRYKREEIRYEYISKKGNLKSFLSLGNNWDDAYNNFKNPNNRKFKESQELILDEYKALKLSLKTDVEKLTLKNKLDALGKLIADEEFYGIESARYNEAKIVIEAIYKRMHLNNIDSNITDETSKFSDEYPTPVPIQIPEEPTFSDIEESYMSLLMEELIESNGILNDAVMEKSSALCKTFGITEDRHTPLLKEATKRFGKREQFTSVIKTVVTDGKISPSKKITLYNLSEKYDLKKETVDSMIKSVLCEYEK